MNKAYSTIATFALIATSTTALAGLDVFDDRSAWQTQAGPTTTENFNGVVSDTDFHPGALIFLGSGLTLQADGEAGDNFIDVVPISPQVDVDGTPVANIFNGQSDNPLYPRVYFSSPVSAFGADFMNLQDASPRTEFELRLEGQVVTTIQPNVVGVGEVRFYGIAANAGELFDEIRFLRLNNDVFGMDNVEWNSGQRPSTPVPVLSPVGLAALFLGVLFLGFRSRFRLQRATPKI